MRRKELTITGTGDRVDHLDLLRETQIGVRDAPGVVRREHDRDLRVSDVDVGMVIEIVGDPGDAVDESNAVGEPLERKDLRKRAAAARPAGKRAKRPLHFEIREFLSHVASRLLVSRGVRFYTSPAIRATGLLLTAFTVAVPCGAQDSVSFMVGSAYWRRFGEGAISSILLHEAGHIATAYAVGGRPTFGFNELRPTIYSGIDSRREPHKQFLFSAAGLTVQSVLDEAILDAPHSRGGAFERGILGGGIGTTLFYLTIGRWGSVSDVDFMARTRALTKTQVTLIFGSIAAEQTFRIWHDPKYAHFFTRATSDGHMEVGIDLDR